jgi:hypothetical protein
MSTIVKDADGVLQHLTPNDALPRKLGRSVALDLLPPSVYFIRHMGAIKIGWSATLGRRISSLAGSSPADLLAFDPGDQSHETAMHRRFAHLRIDQPGYGREHFRSDPDLVSHINGLRARLGLTPIGC